MAGGLTTPGRGDSRPLRRTRGCRRRPVLATSFGLLMISPLIADIGFAVAAGVLLSAFINAFLLVPALTALAGKAAWWPSHPRPPARAGWAPASRPSSLDAATPWN